MLLVIYLCIMFSKGSFGYVDKRLNMFFLLFLHKLWRDKMAKNNSLLLGLIVGGVIGSVATLLSTPSSGKEFRGQINLSREQLENLLAQLKRESKALKDQLIKTAQESSGIVKDVSFDLKKTIQQFQQDIEPHKNDLMKEIEEIDQKIKQLEKNLTE